MSELRKRANSPFYYYRIEKNGTQKWKSTKTKNKKYAMIIKEKWDRDNALSNAGIIIEKNITFRKLVRDYIIQQELVCKATTLNTIYSILKPLNKFFSKIRPSLIDSQKINDYKLMRLSSNTSNKAVKNEIQWVLNGIFKLAIINKLVTDNPVKGFKINNKPFNPTKTISHDKVLEIIDHANEKDKLYIKVLYYTGLSSMDAGTIKAENIIDNKILLVKRRKTQQYAKVPLHHSLIDNCNNLIDLMPTKKEYHCFYQRFKLLLKKVGLIENGYNVMSLRHSINSRLAEKGLHFEDRKKILGQATKVNIDYTHYDIKHTERLINSL